MIVSRHRPESTIKHGCVPLAFAATFGGEDKDWLRAAGFDPEGSFNGMTLSTVEMLLKASNRKYKRFEFWGQRKKLWHVLPINARGLVVVKKKWEMHMLAFEGWMVYDTLSNGKWEWIFSNVSTKLQVVSLFILEEGNGTL